MPKIEWTEDDKKAAREATAIRGAFRSTRGKTITRVEKEPPRKAA